MKHANISCHLFKGKFCVNWNRLKVGKSNGLCLGNVCKSLGIPENGAWGIYCQWAPAGLVCSCPTLQNHKSCSNNAAAAAGSISSSPQPCPASAPQPVPTWAQPQLPPHGWGGGTDLALTDPMGNTHLLGPWKLLHHLSRDVLRPFVSVGFI